MLLVSYPGNQSAAIRRARSADYETVINDLAFCRAREGSFPALCEFPVAGQGSSEQPGACPPRVVGSRPCSRPDWFGVALRSTRACATRMRVTGLSSRIGPRRSREGCGLSWAEAA